MPQPFQPPALQTGYLHLGDPQHPCRPLLGHPVEVAELDRQPLPLRQAGNGLLQGKALHQLLLRGVAAQGPLQGEAVAELRLQGLRLIAGKVDAGDVLHRETGVLRQGGEGRFLPVLVPQPLPRPVK